jgi:hypothetical protein
MFLFSPSFSLYFSTLAHKDELFVIRVTHSDRLMKPITL